MPLPTPSQSVSHKWFHQCVNYKEKISLRHPLPTFVTFSFFQASIWLGVDKVLQKLTKSYKNELRHLFQCCILIPRKCPHKTPFQHTVPLPPRLQHPCNVGPTPYFFKSTYSNYASSSIWLFLESSSKPSRLSFSTFWIWIWLHLTI